MDAISLAEHLERQDITDLKEDIACDFLLDPVLFIIFGPVVAALDLDFALHPQLSTNKHVNVRLLLMLKNQAFIIVHDTFLGINEEILQSILIP